VESVLPAPYHYGADALAEAIEVAARQRTVRQRQEVLVGGGLIAAALVFGLRSS
jgi:hypothetical protein